MIKSIYFRTLLLTCTITIYTGTIELNAQCTQNFDAVTVPALPAGWSAATVTDCVNSNPWKTVNTNFSNSPNAIFINDPGCFSDEYLYSKLIQIVSSTAQITFKRNHDYLAGYLVLEISIDGGEFEDVQDAGCIFVEGYYDGYIFECCGHPLEDRDYCWNNTNNEWVTTTINLPASANGKTVIFGWRRVSDDIYSSSGVYIDDISVTGAACNTSCSGNILLSQSATSLCTGPVLLTASGGGASYQWYKNNIVIPGQTGATHSATIEGIYFATSVISGCTVTSNIVVVGRGSVTPLLGGTGVHCEGANVSIGMPDTENNQQYTWRQNGVAVHSIPIGGGGGNQSLNFTMEAYRAGTYRVESSIPGCLPVYTNFVYVGFPAITSLQTVSLCHNEVKVKWNRVIPTPVSQTYEYELSLSSTPDIADGQTSDSTLTLLVSPSTSYYLHVRSKCGFSSTFGEWSTISFITPANPGTPVTSVWTGNVNTSWTNAGNWQCGLIPATTTEVVLNGGLSNYPVVTANMTIRKMTVNPGATVTVNPGIKLTITGN